MATAIMSSDAIFLAIIAVLYLLWHVADLIYKYKTENKNGNVDRR